MVPSAATPATAEPEISAKNIEAPIVTIDRPPRTKPKQAEVKAISRREMLDAFMIAPARMNSGIASSGKLEAPSNMTSAMFGSMSGPWMIAMAAVATIASATAIGTLSSANANMPMSITAMVIAALRRSCYGRRPRPVPMPP